MLELVTDKGVRELDIDASGDIGLVLGFLKDLESMGVEERLLFIICRRGNTRLTLFDMLLARLHVAVLVLAATQGVLYPTNVLKRRAAGLCQNV